MSKRGASVLDASGRDPTSSPMLLVSPDFQRQRGFDYEQHVLGWSEKSKEVFAVAYVAELEAMKRLDLLRRRDSTRILLRPPGGFTRADAEKLVALQRKIPGFKVRQLRAGAGGHVAHLKVLAFKGSSRLGRSAFIGSSNITNRGIESNLEVNALVGPKMQGFSELIALTDRLWSDELSEPVRPEEFAEFLDGDQPERNDPHVLDFQRDAIRRLAAFYQQRGNGSGAILSLPTGTGKTLIATRFLLEYVLRERGSRVLWVAPQEELIIQAATTFANQYAFCRGYVPRIEPPAVVRSPKDRRSLDVEYDVMFRVLTTAAGAADDHEYDVVVVDEAHWGAAKSRAMLPRLLSSLRCKFFLGLTATPFRRVAHERRFLDEWFPNRVLRPDNLDEECNAVGDRVLAEVAPDSVPTNVRIVIDEKRLAAVESEQQLLSAVKDEGRSLLVARKWNREIHKPTLVFALDAEHAGQLASAFKRVHPEAKVQVMHTRPVDASRLDMVVMPRGDHFSRTEREAVYSRFRRGGIDVLISVNLYTTGVDFPAVQSLFMARPTLSPVLYAQMLGRGRRGPAFGGTKTVHVVDFADQFEAHRELGARLMNFELESGYDELIAKEERRYQSLKRYSLPVSVGTATHFSGSRGVFRVATPGGRKVREVAFAEDVGATLRRLLARGSIRSSHVVDCWSLPPGFDVGDGLYLVRTYFAATERSTPAPAHSPRRTPRKKIPSKAAASTNKVDPWFADSVVSAWTKSKRRSR